MHKIKQQKGFTIIEIMIVLAIAALIMLIVFLAVPALQRSSRNTQRKNDAGNILSAINTYVSNNNGSLPSSTTLQSAISGIHLGYYSPSSVYYGTAIPSVCKTVGTTNCASSPSEVNTEDVIFLPGYSCYTTTTATQTANTPHPGSGRGYAVIYEVETGSNSAQEQCTAS